MANHVFVAQARKLGIENPEIYSSKELRLRIAICKDIQDLYETAGLLELDLPKNITHIGTLRARFNEAVRERLKDVKLETEVLFRGNRYTVTKISKQGSSGVFYSLKPIDGGKAVSIHEVKLLGGMQRDQP